MFKSITLKISASFLGLTSTFLLLTPSASLAQSSLNPLDKNWIELSCDGEPAMTLAPDKQAMIHTALADNEQLQSLFAQLASQKLTGTVLESFLAMANYTLGEFSRRSQGQSIALLTLFLNEQTLATLSEQVKSQWQQEIERACSR